jgi:hypothetical protein
MQTARASLVAALLLAGCSERAGPHNIDDWLPLLSVQEPVRFVKLAQPADVGSCMRPDGTKLIGQFDDAALSQIGAAIRERYPRDVIVLVRVKGRFAEVWTGLECRDPAGGHGDIHHLRRDEGEWFLKETTQWVQ